ncbi:unnamed protein product [Nezara viridula]|uniref:Uncharacterized protein n=1 Tax=Nezara viridula TaxID=85310 RepID=A0A9P0EDM3_NEZVI|nr:unnamed protein product [Nezara viridula]
MDHSVPANSEYLKRTDRAWDTRKDAAARSDTWSGLWPEAHHEEHDPDSGRPRAAGGVPTGAAADQGGTAVHGEVTGGHRCTDLLLPRDHHAHLRRPRDHRTDLCGPSGAGEEEDHHPLPGRWAMAGKAAPGAGYLGNHPHRLLLPLLRIGLFFQQSLPLGQVFHRISATLPIPSICPIRWRQTPAHDEPDEGVADWTGIGELALGWRNGPRNREGLGLRHTRPCS